MSTIPPSDPAAGSSREQQPGSPAIPAEYRGLVDDAAIFPPGDAPMPRAVADHREHVGSPYAGLVGPFVVSDARLPELIDVLRGDAPTPEPLAVSVVVTGGAGAIEPAVRWATRADELALHGLEVALRDESDLAHNARRMLTALDQLLDSGELAEEVPVFVEPPRIFDQPPSHSWLAALDELAAMEVRLKLRTGGVSADAFPSVTELATCIDAALDRELPFKCTAGLHNALRHRDEQTGFEHHGFLNVLLGTRAALDGGDTDEVAAVLARTDRQQVVQAVRDSGDRLAATRRWFASFGSCSVLEPLEDLLDLDLLPDLPLETP